MFAKLIARVIFAVYSEFEDLRNKKNQPSDKLTESVRKILVGEGPTN